MTSGLVRVEREIAGMKLSFETGQVARQAHGSVIATLGETKVLRRGRDFGPGARTWTSSR